MLQEVLAALWGLASWCPAGRRNWCDRALAAAGREKCSELGCAWFWQCVKMETGLETLPLINDSHMFIWQVSSNSH